MRYDIVESGIDKANVKLTSHSVDGLGISYLCEILYFSYCWSYLCNTGQKFHFPQLNCSEYCQHSTKLILL